MARIDITRLRKNAGMSQRELAQRLQVRPSFLSAIENGKSRLPDDKRAMLIDIFGLDSLDGYIIDDTTVTDHFVEPHTHPGGVGDPLTHMLWHFHDRAHKMADAHNEEDDRRRIATLEERNDYLGKRNDELTRQIDSMRAESDRLKAEILRLKEELLLHGIDYRSC